MTRMPNDRISKRLNRRAEVILEAQAITIQEADLDIVSGATYTSQTYEASLQAALDQAAIAAPMNVDTTMNDAWWYLNRSSGVVATVLIVVALMSGLFFSAHATGDRPRPKWWLDLHNYVGGLAFIFTVIHIVAVYLDQLNNIGLTEIFVPMTADGWQWGMTWGVIGTYLFAAVVFSS